MLTNESCSRWYTFMLGCVYKLFEMNYRYEINIASYYIYATLNYSINKLTLIHYLRRQKSLFTIYPTFFLYSSVNFMTCQRCFYYFFFYEIVWHIICSRLLQHQSTYSWRNQCSCNCTSSILGKLYIVLMHNTHFQSHRTCYYNEFLKWDKNKKILCQCHAVENIFAIIC